MNYILATVAFGGNKEDVKIPASITVSELGELLGKIYGISGRNIHAQPKGIVLDRNKTLEEQNVMHGALLTIN